MFIKNKFKNYLPYSFKLSTKESICLHHKTAHFVPFISSVMDSKPAKTSHRRPFLAVYSAFSCSSNVFVPSFQTLYRWRGTKAVTTSTLFIHTRLFLDSCNRSRLLGTKSQNLNYLLISIQQQNLILIQLDASQLRCFQCLWQRCKLLVVPSAKSQVLYYLRSYIKLVKWKV